MSIPKLIKHLTAQQTLGAIQYISNQLDPKNNRVPDIEEIRSFLYLQELVLLFAKKERKGKDHHLASESEEDEDSEESTVKESKKKAKSKKNIQARCKYTCSWMLMFFLFFNCLLFRFVWFNLFRFLLIMVVTKNKDEVDSDSKEDEESDESTEKELKKKAKSKKNIQARCKYTCSWTLMFFVFQLFVMPFCLIQSFPFFIDYGSN